MLTELLLAHAPRRALDILAAPTPAPTGPITGNLNTQAIVAFIASKIAPILITVGACVIIGRAGKGEVSKVLTTTGILILGVVVLAGAGALFLFGNQIVNIAFS